MKIKSLVEDKQVFVPAFLFNSQLGDNPFQMNFMVDTGATRTTILQGDAMRLGIKFLKLKKSNRPVIGVSGKQDVYELEDVILAFEKISLQDLIYVRLEKIDVVKPRKNSIDFPLSVIGVDLLQRFHFDYCNPRASLTCKTHKINGLDYIR